MGRCLRASLLLLAVTTVGCRQAEPTVVYSVSVYDAARDSAADLAATIAVARATNKRILLQVGGNWCKWCHRLDAYIAGQRAVAQALGESFIVMKVNYDSEYPNEQFLSQYPDVPGYPHWFVLDTDGHLLHSQGTADLESGAAYSQAALLQFVERWKN